MHIIQKRNKVFVEDFERKRLTMTENGVILKISKRQGTEVRIC